MDKWACCSIALHTHQVKIIVLILQGLRVHNTNAARDACKGKAKSHGHPVIGQEHLLCNTSIKLVEALNNMAPVKDGAPVISPLMQDKVTIELQ